MRETCKPCRPTLFMGQMDTYDETECVLTDDDICYCTFSMFDAFFFAYEECMGLIQLGYISCILEIQFSYKVPCNKKWQVHTEVGQGSI